MWKNEILIWEDTPNSKWNEFGKITEIDDMYDDDLYAKGVAIWRKATLGEIIDNTMSLFESGMNFLEDRNFLTSVMLTITVISSIPLHIEIIQDDDVADKFLSLITNEESKYYISKEKLDKSEFSKIESLNLLLSDLVNDEVLTETNDKYYINGKILSSVHLWDSDDD